LKIKVIETLCISVYQTQSDKNIIGGIRISYSKITRYNQQLLENITLYGYVYVYTSKIILYYKSTLVSCIIDTLPSFLYTVLTNNIDILYICIRIPYV